MGPYFGVVVTGPLEVVHRVRTHTRRPYPVGPPSPTRRNPPEEGGSQSPTRRPGPKEISPRLRGQQLTSDLSMDLRGRTGRVMRRKTRRLTVVVGRLRLGRTVTYTGGFSGLVLHWSGEGKVRVRGVGVKGKSRSLGSGQ